MKKQHKKRLRKYYTNIYNWIKRIKIKSRKVKLYAREILEIYGLNKSMGFLFGFIWRKFLQMGKKNQCF